MNAVDVDALFVSEAYVNEGPRQKRVRPAPMGRAFRYQRRISHLNIVLAEKAGDGRNAETATTVTAETSPAKKAAKKAPVKKTAAKKRPAKKLAGKKTTKK